MLETLKLSKALKSSRDDFNVLDNFNVSSLNASKARARYLQFALVLQLCYRVT